MIGDHIISDVNHRSEEAGVEDILNSQVLHFDRNFGNEDIRLIELNTELLEALENDGQLVLRGDADENSVICSQNKTFSLKECTTSNSLLLVPDLSVSTDSAELQCRNVLCTKFEYYEAKLSRGKLDKLKDQLAKSGYRGEECELELNSELMTWNGIIETVQASEEEIRKRLDELGAFEMNGNWRVLDHEYKTVAMTRVVDLLIEKQWSWECVPLVEACKILEELQPCFVTEICLRLYGDAVEDNTTGESDTVGGVTIRLSEAKVSRFYGEYILSASIEGKFSVSEFMYSWQDVLPEGMKCDMDHLAGLIMIDKDLISYLPVSSLPIDPPQRFAALFMKKPKWTHDEIVPFVNDLAGPGQTVNALLLKYCRSSTDHATNTKVYNSKALIQN